MNRTEKEKELVEHVLRIHRRFSLPEGIVAQIVSYAYGEGQQSIMDEYAKNQAKILGDLPLRNVAKLILKQEQDKAERL